jgi:hypothetical protein
MCLDDVSDRYVLNMRDVGAILDVWSTKAGELCATGQIVGAFRAGSQLRIFAGDLRKHFESVRLPHDSPISRVTEVRAAPLTSRQFPAQYDNAMMVSKRL